MFDLNQVCLSGFVVADAELKTVANKSVLNFDFCNHTYGKKEQHSNFYKVEFWGKLAEQAKEFTKKGNKIVVTGEISIESYEKKDSTGKVTYVKIRATNIISATKNKK